MSDNETVDVEVITPSIEDMLDAIAGDNALDSQKMFADLMSAKVSDALEAEKVRVAGQIFNGETELEVSLENLANHLELEIFITAKEGFEYYDTSFNEDYLLGQNKGVFTIKRGDIVGWGGKMRISLGQSFINSAQRMFQFKPNSNPYVEIDLTDQNCIIVNYPKKLNEDDVDMMNYLTKSNPFVSLQIFIIPALIEAISEIRKQGENTDDFINDYSWAMILHETIDRITDESVTPSLLAQEYVTNLLRKNRPLSHLLLTELKGN